MPTVSADQKYKTRIAHFIDILDATIVLVKVQMLVILSFYNIKLNKFEHICLVILKSCVLHLLQLRHSINQ